MVPDATSYLQMIRAHVRDPKGDLVIQRKHRDGVSKEFPLGISWNNGICTKRSGDECTKLAIRRCFLMVCQ